jgi:hypothetical protein
LIALYIVPANKRSYIVMAKPEKSIVFFIGEKKYETTKEHLTVREILEDFAKVSPDKYTLALKEQGEFHEYTNLDEAIEMKNGMKFVLFDKTPTTVS